MRFTLVTDGSSDTVLLYILDWLLKKRSRELFESTWADLRGYRPAPRSLSERLKAAMELYPCDLLFVHRDAERSPHGDRVAEIRAALPVGLEQPVVCVVPVRMQEAWLQIDEQALRTAAGRPHGTTALEFPVLRALEAEPDPKRLLHDLLRRASGLTGRRAKRFRPDIQAHRLAELIEDYSPLLQLQAFKELERDLNTALAVLGAAAQPQNAATVGPQRRS